MRTILILGLCAVSAPAMAAERSVGVGSFDRLRVTGPFGVTVTAGSPSARITGEAAAIDAVEVRLDGTTLTVRRRSGLTDSISPTATAPLRIALATPALTGAVSLAGAKITIAKLRGQRVDLSVGGSGEIAATAIDALEVVAVLAGAGRLSLSGKAAKVRLTKNGEGTLDASALDAGDLAIFADGVGTLAAHGRYVAQVGNAGTGQVTVAGTPRCVIRPADGGPVTCGARR